MRSMRFKVGVASTIVAVLALTVAVSLGEQRRAGRLGHRVRDEGRLRRGHRQEGQRARRSSSAGSTC